MNDPIPPVCRPDLSSRPFQLTVERTMPLPPDAVFRAWTERFDLWFAAPGSVLMTAAVNAPFFFETRWCWSSSNGGSPGRPDRS